MARKTKTTEEMAFAGWNPWTSDENGRWPLNDITAASTVQCAVELRAIRLTLQSILSNIVQLGNDGIHEVIRKHRTRLRREEKVRRDRNKREREARRLRGHAGRTE